MWRRCTVLSDIKIPQLCQCHTFYGGSLKIFLVNTEQASELRKRPRKVVSAHGGRSYLSLKRVLGQRRRFLSIDALVGTTLLDCFLVELVEAQIVDEHVQRNAHRPVEVAAALIIVQQRVEGVPAAIEKVLGPRRVVVLAPAMGAAEEGARVTGERRPASLEAQSADVDRYPVVVGVFVVHGRRCRQRG